jgi:Nickel responsive protein SCO4226-like
MNSYLVERYIPGLSETDVRAALERVQAVCAELSADGAAIRYVGSIFLPVEEACFCRFDSDRPETVAGANEQAELPYARITAGLAIEPAEVARPEPIQPIGDGGD